MELGPEYQTSQEMKPELITGNYTAVIQPRVSKSEEEKLKRTRDKAEVFTPSWVCNEQNNLVDAARFGRQNVFNRSSGKRWETILEPVQFPRDKIWKDYVDARRMEISCGEAPYLVSRYDTVSGDFIPVVSPAFRKNLLLMLPHWSCSGKDWMSGSLWKPITT